MSFEEPFDLISHAITYRPGKASSDVTGIGIPDYERAVTQHKNFCDVLQRYGVNVTVLSDFPLTAEYFISNMAVITEYLAVVGNFSDGSPRQNMQKNIASALAGNKFLKFITAPGRLDCRDVLQIKDHFYIGLSEHTNQEGAAQLAFFLSEYGYKVTMLNLDQENLVRLDTAATYIGQNRLLVREELARNYAFIEYNKIVIPYHERGIADVVRVNGRLIIPTGYPETTNEIKRLGLRTAEVNISEFEKMNGSLSCLSLLMPRLENENITITLPAKKSQQQSVA